MIAEHISGLVEVACPLCGESGGKILAEVKDWAFACSNDSFVLKRCSCCGCGYLSVRPLEEDMPRYYPPLFYWSWERTPGALSWSEILERRRPQLEAKAVWLDGLSPGRLLDVGAQKGEFLWFMHKRGWQVEGIEVDRNVPNPEGMPIRYGDFLTMELAPESYDVITFWAVLEHVYRPTAFVQKAVSLLKPGGRLVVLVTNLQSVQARWLLQDDYPRHLTIFTKSSLRRLAEAHGLHVISCTTDQKIFGGALNGGLVYAYKRLRGYGRDEAFYEWKQPNDPHRFWVQWKGKPSQAVRWVSRLDRLLTRPLEFILDRLGYGFILTAAMEKNK